MLYITFIILIALMVYMNNYIKIHIPLMYINIMTVILIALNITAIAYIFTVNQELTDLSYERQKLVDDSKLIKDIISEYTSDDIPDSEDSLNQYHIEINKRLADNEDQITDIDVLIHKYNRLSKLIWKSGIPEIDSNNKETTDSK